MDKLPPELLLKIMLNLPLEDRLSCSLTCRRWAEAMSSSKLLDDVWLDIAGHEMEAATSVLVNSQRQYMQMLLHKADLSEFHPAFWGKIGANLRVLELEECSWSPYAFYAILQQCPKLESLKLARDCSRKISIDDFVPPEDACHEELRDSLSHLRHLHLDFKLTASILDLLLGLMSNVTSIFLSSSFEKESDFLERLPSILNKNRIIHLGTNFHKMGYRSQEVIRFVEITFGSLEELQMYVFPLPRSSCRAIVNCTRLRRLTLNELYSSFDESDLKQLVLNSPDLEILELDDINFEDEDMVHLFELKKLRTLSLGGWGQCVITNEFLCSLRRLSTLVELELKWFSVDSRVIQSLGSLTNLRKLALDDCESSECFEAICENFDRLTELHLGTVENLTDADGIRLCRFKELRSLSFKGGEGFTDLTFERGVGSRAMKSLVISGCSMTDAGLVSIASHHDRLETLSLYHCKNITDAGVVALLQNERRLKELVFGCCASVRYGWRTALRNICPRLRDSRIDDDSPRPDDFLPGLIAALSNLDQ